MKKIYSYVILLFVSVFLVSCASEGVVQKSSISTKASSGTALINFVVIQLPNEGELYLGPPWKAAILVDGKRIAILGKNEATQTSVQLGKHKITTYWKGSGWNKTHVTMNFESEKIYYFGVGDSQIKSITYGEKSSIVTLDKGQWLSYSSQ